MKLRQLLEGLDCVWVQGELEREAAGLAYDSRKAVPDGVFVCISGTAADGHDYIPDALERGCGVLVVEREVSAPPEVTVLRVENARKALGVLSAAWFGHPARQLVTIGITGTKGKTTTAYMIRSILERAGLSTGLVGTIECLTGKRHIPASHTTPESYELQGYFREMVEAGCRCVVMEVSSQALKLERVAGFHFDYGIFTNLSEDHISPLEHADLEEYAACKAELFRRCGVGILNADDPAVDRMLAGHTCRVETYGCTPEADLYASEPVPVCRPGCLGVSYQLGGAMRGWVEVDIPGEFTVYNSLAAIALCRHLKVSWADMRDALRTVQVKGRLETVPVPGDYTLMIDYAHNAGSLESLLTSLRRFAPGRLICLFGCGGNRSRSRRWEMGEVSSRLADLTVVTSDNPRWEEPMDIIEDILTGVKRGGGAFMAIPDRKEAIRCAMRAARAGDFVILAGKGHEDYQEIRGIKRPMDERVLIREILEEEKIPSDST